MKAQAKKILALIMAMVMCLSLAAPAFAAYNKDASESPKHAAGTWTYVAADDVALFTEVTLDAKGKELPTEITKGAKKYDNKDTAGLAADTTYYKVGATYYTVNGTDAVPVTDAGVTAALGGIADDKWTAVPVQYTAKKTFATRIDASANDGTYTVYGFKKGGKYTADENGDIKEVAVCAGDVKKGKDNQPKDVGGDTDADVTATKNNAGQDQIGEPVKGEEWTVSFPGSTAAVTVTVKTAKDGPKKAIDNVKAEDWKALDKDQTFKWTDGNKYQVSGSVYQESWGDGLVKAYFKLATVNELDNFSTSEDDILYFVTPDTVAAINSADAMSNALASAVVCTDSYGTKGSDGIVAKKAGLKVKQVSDDTVWYTFTAHTPSKNLTVGATKASESTNKVTIEFGSDEDVTTGTFQMAVVATTKPAGSTNTTDANVTSADEAKKLLEKNCVLTRAKIESVEASSGGYFTVTVSRVKDAKAYEADTNKFSKNVWYYKATSSSPLKALLFDLADAGWYNGESKEGSNSSALAAGTECLGPVVVRVSDVSDGYNAVIPDNVKCWYEKDYPGTGAATSEYYIFNSVDDMKATFTATSCKGVKPIPYAQVVLNPYNGDKQNKLVTIAATKKSVVVKKSDLNYVAFTQTPVAAVNEQKNIVSDVVAEDTNYEVKLAGNFYSEAFTTPNAAFVKKDTLQVESAAHKNKVEVIEKIDATCETPGKKVKKITCTDCNTVISETTEEIPVVTTPVEKNTTDKETINGDEYDRLVFDSKKTVDPVSKHFLKEAKTTTTVSEDKKTTVITTEYYCNLGVLHKNETRVITINKADLQHAGKFNFFQLGDRDNKIYPSTADDETNLFGYDKIVIADCDVENESVPMNRKKGEIPSTNLTDTDANGNDIVFEFKTTDLDPSVSATKNDDGSIWNTDTVTLKNVYATATSAPVRKDYVAKLTAKNIKKPAAVCLTGSATLVAEVYEVSDGYTGNAADTTDAISSVNLEKNLKNNKVKLLQTFTEDIVLRATSYHTYDDKTGICKTCLQGVQAVEEAMFTADTVTVENLTWTGKVAQPKVTVYDTKGNKLLKGIDYVVEQVEETDAGEHTITIKGLEDYSGNRVTVPYTIEKVAGTLKKKSAPSKLTASATKKVTGQIKMTVKGGKVAKYKVTGKVSGVSVNKKGKITVKKGNKKAGTLKVKVTMTPDANHTAAKAVTVKVAIKAAPAAKKTTKK